jgi:hypothetical protein
MNSCEMDGYMGGKMEIVIDDNKNEKNSGEWIIIMSE